MTYGHQVAEEGDNYVDLADKALSSLAHAGIFGTYLVVRFAYIHITGHSGPDLIHHQDYLPVLKYVPAWFPFASFQRQALEWRKSTSEMVSRPFNMIQDQMVSHIVNICSRPWLSCVSSKKQGIAVPCLVSEELEKRALGSDFTDEETIKNVAATAYAGI